MHDGLTNICSFEMNKRPITLVPLTVKHIYDEQLKLKTWKMDKKESLCIKKTFFVNKVLMGFDDDIIFLLGTDLFSLREDLHVIDSRLIPLEEGGGDINQVKS